MRLAALVLLAGCGSHAAVSLDAPPPAETHALGLSDISILLPLPADLTQPVVATVANSGDPIVDNDWFQFFVIDKGDILPKSGEMMFTDFHVVAVRVDLCDRSTVGPCPTNVDGQLRLVAQPLVAGPTGTIANDVAVHLFYTIPEADLPGVITELRALARIQDLASDSPLVVSPAAGTNDEYTTRLRALVMKYAHADNLVRFTVAGQEASSGAFAWRFRGLDHVDGTFKLITIPNAGAGQQNMLLAGGDIVYNTDFTHDVPVGFDVAIDGVLFDPAPREFQIGALEALTAVQNPLLHNASDTQCIACHVATYLTPYRAMELGVDPKTVAGYYQTTRPVAVDTVANQDPRVVRAFGWVAALPAISQVVTNTTAELLDEVDARYPVP